MVGARGSFIVFLWINCLLCLEYIFSLSTQISIISYIKYLKEWETEETAGDGLLGRECYLNSVNIPHATYHYKDLRKRIHIVHNGCLFPPLSSGYFSKFCDYQSCDISLDKSMNTYSYYAHQVPIYSRSY